ncbi:hypothetical protein KKG31_05010 [Patescibacteria group bacterium]|nr:hypothetical protein [Patescibacteria group bacterium]MBU1758483.1 hypothetical protein [Patescibacteria group bacterium]
MKSIENNLRSALRVKEDIAVDNAYNIAPSNVTNEKEWQDTQKAISDLSTTIKNDIDRVIGKFEEFYIPIDKPNDLINFAKNKEPGIKSRQDAIKKHRDDISDKLNTKINDLKKRAEVYEKSEESKAVDKIYAEFND